LKYHWYSSDDRTFLDFWGKGRGILDKGKKHHEGGCITLGWS
jgi:hypothetical protein